MRPSSCLTSAGASSKPTSRKNVMTTHVVLLLLMVIWNTTAAHKWISAGAVQLFHVPPNNGTRMSQLLGSKSVGLPHKVSGDLFL